MQGKAIKTKTYDSVLLVNIQTYGDYLLKYKFLSALIKKYHPRTVAVITNNKGHQVYSLMADSLGVNLSIHVFDRGNSYASNLKALARARQIKSEVLFCLDQNRYSYIISFLMKPKAKIGFYQSIDQLFTKSGGFIDKKSNSPAIETLAKVFFTPKLLREPADLHESDVELALLDAAAPGIVDLSRTDSAHQTAVARDPAPLSSQPYIYISTQSRWIARSLSTSKTVEIIQAIRRAMPEYVVYFADTNPSMASIPADPHVRPYLQKPDLRDFRDFIAGASFVISIDSFPVHMASFCNTPIIAMFGPAPAHRFMSLSSIQEIIYNKPKCSPCVQHVGTDVCEMGYERCLAFDSVDVPQVMGAIQRVRDAIYSRSQPKIRLTS